MVIIGLNMSVHKPFNQAGMREERNPIEAFTLFIGLAFCQGTYPEN